jgi:hypothetical protein
MSQNNQNLLYVLDAFSHRDINRWKQQYREVAAYFWDHYSYFSHQRSLIIDELKTSLRVNCIAYEFSDWRRAVDYRYSDNPLSSRGSILNETGGRFNIGDIDQMKFPRFAGLYLAVDNTTALKEKFGISTADSGLTAEELNLAGDLAIVKVRGKLTNVLNLCDPESLNEFYTLIKKIHLPLKFISRAKELKITAMLPVKNVKELLNTLLREEWRVVPMQFDIPSNPQILGQLAYAAGIEGILYPSVKTQKECLVIYPENFCKSDGYIELDSVAPDGVINRRIDATSYVSFL